MDPYERLIIEKHGVTAFGMEDVEHYGNIREYINAAHANTLCTKCNTLM